MMSAKLTLVVLAAGIGRRYGGLKQIEPVGPSGEFIVDYSVYDAMRAGFGCVVFVIRKDIEETFRAAIGSRIERQLRVEYVFQEITTALPEGCAPDRKKPWGTAHAVMICGEKVHGPFAVANGDDFYGRHSYRALADFMTMGPADESAHCMVGYALGNTLSDHGAVSRGICRSTADGLLQEIVETPGIEKKGGAIVAGGRTLAGNDLVSMNLWGFKPSIFRHLTAEWPRFLETARTQPELEFFLPTAVDRLIRARACSVRALETASAWFGITNREDRQTVVERIRQLVAAGEYPARLWG